MFFRIVTALFLISAPATAQVVESVYTNLNFETDCVWSFSEFEEEAAQGGTAVCEGLDGYPVYLSDFDDRQYLNFGPDSDQSDVLGGFVGFNYVNDVVEWRLHDKQPIAVIIRWFVSAYDEATEGFVEAQILTVMTVADPALPVDQRFSCPVAYVDALANANANQLARQVAFLAAPNFRCGVDQAIYVGEKGPRSAMPNHMFDGLE